MAEPLAHSSGNGVKHLYRGNLKFHKLMLLPADIPLPEEGNQHQECKKLWICELHAHHTATPAGCAAGSTAVCSTNVRESERLDSLSLGGGWYFANFTRSARRRTFCNNSRSSRGSDAILSDERIS